MKFKLILVTALIGRAVCSFGQDPDLELGFPVYGQYSGGTTVGPAILTVGDITGDGIPELAVSPISNGPLYMFSGNGTTVPGWPYHGGYQYSAMGKFRNEPGLQVFSVAKISGSSGEHVLLRNNGTVVPWWPRPTSNYVSSPGSAADIDNDGYDEMFCGSQLRTVYGYAGAGSNAPGWPRTYINAGGQSRSTPLIVDLDQDSYLDLICHDEQTTNGNTVLAYSRVGLFLPGFPVVHSFAGDLWLQAICDIDGDFVPELISRMTSFPPSIVAIGNDGTIKRTYLLPVLPQSSGLLRNLAVGDLNGDGSPEFVVGCETGMYALQLDGTQLPGWPIQWTTAAENREPGLPLIGDVTGDGVQDVVIQCQDSYRNVGELRVYEANGQLHPNFPKAMPSSVPMGNPAIADIDGDGRNELIAYRFSGSGFAPMLWAYDLHGSNYGHIEWGQWLGSARHTGYYLPKLSRTLLRSFSSQGAKIVSGNTASARHEDSSLLVFQPTKRSHNELEVIAEGFAPELVANNIEFSLRASASTRGVRYEVSEFDWSSNSWFKIRSGNVGTALIESRSVISIAPQRFFAALTHKLQFRIRFSRSDQFRDNNWKVSIDRAAWFIERLP